MRIASSAARFALIFVKRGLALDGGASFFITRLGALSGLEMALSGDVIGEKEALRLGLVNRVIPEAEFGAYIVDYAERMAKNAPLALAAIKKAVHDPMNTTLDDTLQRRLVDDRGNLGLTLRLEWEDEWGVGPEGYVQSRIPPGSENMGALLHELEAGKALADALFASSYDGICILDGQGVFLEVNAAFERMTGIPRDQWIGRRVEEIQRLAGVPKNSATLQALRGNRPASTLVNVHGGELVLITASPHFGPDGTVCNVILNMRNITQLNTLKFQLERERGSAKLASLADARRRGCAGASPTPSSTSWCSPAP